MRNNNWMQCYQFFKSTHTHWTNGIRYTPLRCEQTLLWQLWLAAHHFDSLRTNFFSLPSSGNEWFIYIFNHNMQNTSITIYPIWSACLHLTGRDRITSGCLLLISRLHSFCFIICCLLQVIIEVKCSLLLMLWQLLFPITSSSQTLSNARARAYEQLSVFFQCVSDWPCHIDKYKMILSSCALKFQCY